MSGLATTSVLRLAGLVALTALANCGQTHGMQPPQTLDPGPSRANPIHGTRKPNPAAPPGVLPNPHTNPQ